MSYKLSAFSSKTEEGKGKIGVTDIPFGVSKNSDLPSPAELLVAAFAACCLKNVERFSEFMKFDYSHAEITVEGIRQDKPPMMSKINFSISIFTEDTEINTGLLLRNLQKFGTIYNTLDAVCEIEGDIKVQTDHS
jgi:uncharacterized OsmC-like protein